MPIKNSRSVGIASMRDCRKLNPARRVEVNGIMYQAFKPPGCGSGWKSDNGRVEFRQKGNARTAWAVDRQNAAWLRELIKAGEIADGQVDERSILEVRPDDIRGFVQCHFFAGIGGWSYALRLAGWPDSRPVWTASLPCQPFSDAGLRLGEADERHLWPHFRELLRQCQAIDLAPATLFGEQVASKAGKVWLAGVRTDLEALGRGVCAADLCAAGAAAPHIRQRLFWMAYASGHRLNLERRESGVSSRQGKSAQRHQPDDRREDGRVADADRDGRPAGRRNARGTKHDAQHRGRTSRVGDTKGERHARSEHGGTSGQEESERPWVLGVGGSGEARWMGDAKGGRRGERRNATFSRSSGHIISAIGPGFGGMGDAMREGLPPSKQKAVGRSRRGKEGRAVSESSGASGGLADAAGTPGPKHEREPRQGLRRPAAAGNRADRGGLGVGVEYAALPAAARGDAQRHELPGAPTSWDDFDLVPCRDDKARRVEAGTFPLDHGLPGRVGLLRGYGNAIVPILAAEFIQASEEAVSMSRHKRRRAA